MYYILMKKGFEYNDEGYDATAGGTPKSVFTNEEEAQQTMLKLEFKAWKDNPLRDFDWGLYKCLREYYGLEVENWTEWTIPSNTTFEKFIELYNMYCKRSGGIFYEIVKVN